MLDGASPAAVGPVRGVVAEDEPAEDEVERGWSLEFKYPVDIGYSDFELGSGEAIDSLTTLSVVPTAEFIRTINREWKVIPFVGLGGGWLIDPDQALAIFTAGVRAEWTRQLDEDWMVQGIPRVRYDANLTRPDGLLGDWGRADLAFELRRAFGPREDRIRFQPGLYAQGLWYWNDIEFEAVELAPDSVHKQVDLGISLGTTEPIEVLGIPLPRVYMGVRSGDGIETFSIRFGSL